MTRPSVGCGYMGCKYTKIYFMLIFMLIFYLGISKFYQENNINNYLEILGVSIHIYFCPTEFYLKLYIWDLIHGWSDNTSCWSNFKIYTLKYLLLNLEGSYFALPSLFHIPWASPTVNAMNHFWEFGLHPWLNLIGMPQ